MTSLMTDFQQRSESNSKEEGEDSNGLILKSKASKGQKISKTQPKPHTLYRSNSKPVIYFNVKL